MNTSFIAFGVLTTIQSLNSKGQEWTWSHVMDIKDNLVADMLEK